MSTRLLSFAASSLLLASLTADSQRTPDPPFTIQVGGPEEVTPNNVVKWTTEQLPAWKAAKEARFEGPQLRAIEDDWNEYLDAVHNADIPMQDAMKVVLWSDWQILEAVDESLEGIDII